MKHLTRKPVGWVGCLLALSALGTLCCSGQRQDDPASRTPEAVALDGPAQAPVTKHAPVTTDPSATAEAPVMADSLATTEVPTTSFAIYTLSRGKGVPAEAQDVMSRALSLVDRDRQAGLSVRSSSERLGLEGETRLCVEYEDRAAADEALRQLRVLAEGVDLLNLVTESCTNPKPPASGNQEEN